VAAPTQQTQLLCVSLGQPDPVHQHIEQVGKNPVVDRSGFARSASFLNPIPPRPGPECKQVTPISRSIHAGIELGASACPAFASASIQQGLLLPLNHGILGISKRLQLFSSLKSRSGSGLRPRKPESRIITAAPSGVADPSRCSPQNRIVGMADLELPESPLATAPTTTAAGVQRANTLALGGRLSVRPDFATRGPATRRVGPGWIIDGIGGTSGPCSGACGHARQSAQPAQHQRVELAQQIVHRRTNACHRRACSARSNTPKEARVRVR